MTTVNLDLSRQLQETFPEWETEYYWMPVGTPQTFSITTRGDVIFCSSMDRSYIAPTLDELRIFALELIGPEPDAYTLTSAGDERWEDWIDKMNELKNALIQGCDATAEFILNTFGGK